MGTTENTKLQHDVHAHVLVRDSQSRQANLVLMHYTNYI